MIHPRRGGNWVGVMSLPSVPSLTRLRPLLAGACLSYAIGTTGCAVDVEDPDFELSPRSDCRGTDCDLPDPCGEHGTYVEDATGLGGCQCDPGYAGSACEWSLDEVLPEFIGLSDPTGWSLDPASGRLFRRATQLEIETNGWQPGAFVVTLQGLDQAFATGAPQVDVTLPTSDFGTMTLALTLRATDTSRRFLEIDGRGMDPAGGGPTAVAHGFNPTIDSYGSVVTGGPAAYDLHGALAVGITARERGEFQISGIAERPSLVGSTADHLAIANPDPDWFIQAVPGANPAAQDLYLVTWGAANGVPALPPNNPSDICANPIHVPHLDPGDWHPCDLLEPDPPGDCANDQDDDGDGLTDDDDDMCGHTAACDPATPGKNYPPHTHTTEAGRHFGLMGEVVWCTRHKSNWVTAMYTLGHEIEDTFGDNPGEPGHTSSSYDSLLASGHKPMIFSAAKCWLLEDHDAAVDCRDTDDCGPFDGAPHDYPYGGLGDIQNNYASYLGAAKGSDLAHAAQLPAPNRIDYPLDLVQVVAFDGFNPDFGGKTTNSCDRASLLNDTSKTDSNKVASARSSAHEFGHSYSCDHCDARLLEGYSWDSWSLMHTDAPVDCPHDDFDEDVTYENSRFAAPCANAIAARVKHRDVEGYCDFGGPTFGY